MNTPWIEGLTRRERRRLGVVGARYILATDPNGGKYQAYHVDLRKPFLFRGTVTLDNCDVDVAILQRCRTDEQVMEIVLTEIEFCAKAMRYYAWHTKKKDR
jgi:hypothetical protein